MSSFTEADDDEDVPGGVYSESCQGTEEAEMDAEADQRGFSDWQDPEQHDQATASLHFAEAGARVGEDDDGSLVSLFSSQSFMSLEDLLEVHAVHELH